MITPNTESAYHLFHDGILALQKAESAGIVIDVPYVQKKIFHLKRKIDYAEENFKNSDFYRGWQESTKDGKVNVNSHAQLAHYLYDVLGYEPTKLTASGKGSTDAETLLSLNIPEFTALLEKAKIKKLIDVLEGFEKEQVDGVLHTSFNLHTVSSYRSSSSGVNFQNIPKRDEEAMQICRRAIYPRKGHQLLEIDASGMEVRIACTYHKDETMLEYIRNPKSDLHADMTKQIFMLDEFDKSIPEHNHLRQATKNGFVFPEFYGDYYKNCAESLACDWGKLSQKKWKAGEGVSMPVGTLSDHLISKGIKSYDTFVKHIQAIEKDFWGKRFFQYAAWKETWWNLYKKYGYVPLHTGFQCSGLMNKRQAINMPIQGVSFHCLLYALIEVTKIGEKEKWDSKIIGQIHDSLVIDVHPDEAEHVYKTVKRVFCEDLLKVWTWINIPMEIEAEICDIDQPWSNKKKYSVK